MARKPRYYLADVPCHIILRGKDGERCFFKEADYGHFLDWLGDASRRYGCPVHAYVLMPDHLHLLLTPSDRKGVSSVMQSVGRRYVRYINETYGRSGTLWDGRHKASLVDPENFLLTCYRYIEQNPVRHGIAAKPADYLWSSYRAHAQGKADAVIEDRPEYLTLGKAPVPRRKAYRDLFKKPVSAEDLAAIRSAANLCVPLGGDRFKKDVARRLHKKISYLPRGRPRKPVKRRG
jgi:putative transposase